MDRQDAGLMDSASLCIVLTGTFAHAGISSEKLADVPTFLHVKEQLQGAQVPDMDPVDSTAHRLPTEVRVFPAC